MSTKPSPAAAGASFERNTRQRGAILGVFTTSGRPLSTIEVLEAARDAGTSVSLATVYRAIRALVDEGSLVAVDMPGGAFFELAGKAHHHHFACERCGRVYELSGCVDAERIALPRGFRASGHDLTVRGTCRACRNVDAG